MPDDKWSKQYTQTRIRRPVFKLKFYTENGDYQIVEDSSNLNNAYATESIIAFDAKNSMGDDSSAFSITLVGDTAWENLLKENDLVSLRVQPNEHTDIYSSEMDKVDNDLILFGLVSEVRLVGTYGEDKKEYVITGQSYQKAFIQFELRSIQQVNLSLDNVGWMEIMGQDANTVADNKGSFTMGLVGSDVEEVINALLERFKKYMVYNFTTSGETQTTHFLDHLRLNISSWGKEEESLTNPLPYTSFEGTFNQLLESAINKPFNEMFFDCNTDDDGTEYSVLYVRKTPFDHDDWYNLHEHVVQSRDIISEEVARNDLEACSIFNVVPGNITPEIAMANAKPVFHPKLVEKYGYRLMEVTDNYAKLDEEAKDEPAGGGDGSGEGFSGDVQDAINKVAQERGWSQSDVDAISWIIQHESSGDVHAKNPASTAYGLGQMLDYNYHYYSKYSSDWRDNAYSQVAGTADYIQDRYGTPSDAMSFWQSNGWY